MRTGVTLPELLMTMGIATILFTIGGIAFANLQSESQLDLYASEIRGYMLKSQARTLNHIDSGVYFEPQRFVYFEGAAYVEGDPMNEEVAIPDGLVISQITFPSNILRFAAVTGYVDSFADPAQVVLTETQTSKTRTVKVNSMGVVIVQ